MVFAFSLTNRQSFDELERDLWEPFQRAENSSSCVAVLVGCQADKAVKKFNNKKIKKRREILDSSSTSVIRTG